MTRIVNLDNRYYEKINLDIPLQSKYIMYSNKVEKTDYFNRMRD